MKSSIRRQLKLTLFMSCSFMFVLIAADKVLANKKSEVTSLEMVQYVTTAPSDRDKDWPIVRTERAEKFDDVTGTNYLEVLIVRQSPMSSTTSVGDETCVEIIPLANCVKTATASFYLTGTRSSAGGWITSHAKHWTDVICNGSDCVYKRPTKLEVWWTRSGTSWHASAAYAGWGCYGCSQCGGDSWQSVWIESPAYTPAWQNNTNSFVYVYTSTSYPGLFSWDSITDRASIDSDAYEGSINRGHMSVNPGFG